MLDRNLARLGSLEGRDRSRDVAGNGNAGLAGGAHQREVRVAGQPVVDLGERTASRTQRGESGGHVARAGDDDPPWVADTTRTVQCRSWSHDARTDSPTRVNLASPILNLAGAFRRRAAHVPHARHAVADQQVQGTRVAAEVSVHIPEPRDQESTGGVQDLSAGLNLDLVRRSEAVDASIRDSDGPAAARLRHRVDQGHVPHDEDRELGDPRGAHLPFLSESGGAQGAREEQESHYPSKEHHPSRTGREL